MEIIYFLIAILTTIVGALTGMGGGVLIKPFLDLIGTYDPATISLLSSLSVFSMSIVAIIKQLFQKAKLDIKIVLPLGLGAVIGGNIGQTLLDKVISSSENKDFISIIQNAILCGMLMLIFYYMINKDKYPSKELKGFGPSACVGLVLGLISAFLGIGGGPMNVAAFVYLFSYDTKVAALSSLVTIIFSQIAKLGLVAVTTGFSTYDLSVAPYMIVGAIMGGFIGSKMTFKFTENQIEKAFNWVQVLVMLLCIINIILMVL